MSEKVDITIEKRNNYVSVGFNTEMISSAIPCDTEEDVINSMRFCASEIRKMGKIPAVKNYVNEKRK